MSVCRKYREKLSKCTLVLLAVFLNVSNHAAAITQLDKHVHGESELTIAFENQRLEIELLSPAMNIVGFEHKAKTDDEIAAVNKAMALLRHHDEMFTLSNGDCELINYSVDVSSVSVLIGVESNHTTTNNAATNNAESKHKDNAHSQHLKTQHLQNQHLQNQHHEHLPNTNNEQINNHSEVIAHYGYHCEKTSIPPNITVKIFNVFTGVNHITAMWITETQQGSAILSPTNTTINLK